MTIEDGRFVAEDTEEILDALIEGAEDAFGEEFTPDEVSVIRAHYLPIAQFLADQQEDIRDVMDSAHIDYAQGSALDALTALIGVQRDPANPSSCIQRFDSDSRVKKSYTIPAGSEVQTDEADPVVFATDERRVLRYLDGFEDDDLDEYDGGDKNSFATGVSEQKVGNYGLIGFDSVGAIWDTTRTLYNGSRFHYYNKLESNAVAQFLLGIQDSNNRYEITLDQSAGTVSVDLLDGGSSSTINSASVSLPTGEWLDVRVDWKLNGDWEVYIEDSGGAELVTLTASESAATFTEGYFGFRTNDTNNYKYWDEVTMSRTSVPVTSDSTGVDSNTGANTVTVFRQQLTGIDSTTNITGATGGSDRENDDELRERAKGELSQGMSATLPAVINGIADVKEVRDTSVIVNDSPSDDSDGRPSHSFEAIVAAPSDSYQDVAEAIINNKAAGDIPVGGYAGTKVTKTVELTNGQTKEIDFSTPTEVQIYVDCSLTKESTYEGDEAVQDSIVDYIGGVLNSGVEIFGELGTGDDVIYNQVLNAVMSVEGVVDVTNLEVDTSSSPTGTSNISIADSDLARSDATDSSLSITSSDA